MTQTRSEILAPEGSGFIPPKLTYDEFLHKFYGKHVEYVNAKVIGPMTVDLRHYQLTRFLGSLLQFYVEEKELGVIFGERFQMKMEFQDSIHGREPDVFFVTKENLHRLSDRFYDGGADLVVEIISPDSAPRHG